MTIEQLGQKIKTKYPQYKDIPDADLGQKMVEKYPVYSSQIDGKPTPDLETNVTDTFLTGHPVLRGISDFIGTTGLAKGVAQGIFLKFTPEGKEMTKLIAEGKANYSDLEKIVGKASNKEIVGSAIQTGASITALGKAPAKAISRVALGTGVGAGIGAGKALEKGGGIKEVAKGTAIGAGTGLAVSGVLEGISAGVRWISQSKAIQARTGATYTKALQPPKKEIAKDIERGFKSFGEEVANVVDDKGKPVYVGGYKTLLQKAKDQLATKGGQLKSALASNKTATITRDEVAEGVQAAMENNYGKLTTPQIKQINFEVSRMPEKMDLSGLEDTKRMFDNLIPDSFWSKIDDPGANFPSLVKYTLRDNARKLIDIKSANPLIQKLNREMSVAMDVRKLVSSQLATKELQRLSGSSSYISKVISKVLDTFILNPAETTRLSQAVRTAGTKVGQTVPRQAVRLGVTKGVMPEAKK